VETRRADTKRRRQAETVARIVGARTRPSSRYVILGDLNDPPESPCLAPLLTASELGLVNGLASPEETRPARPDTPPPPTTAWTHRYKSVGQPAQYHLFDQIWLSPALAQRQTGAWIDRRTKHSGDGSDHDPAWVRLRL
ncbi:MAG: endonuclease/exonuclease/phosphatase family protein, partial [Chloroflexota bacterium]|nr:endonuclease/exonuclease/phosphatase family protein [Chloroflexota bacterium]